MKFILSVFSFFLFFLYLCDELTAEKFIAKDQSNEKINCKPGERKEIKKEKFICVRADGSCYCNYSYKCVENCDCDKKYDKYNDHRFKLCPHSRYEWTADFCHWLLECDPNINECQTTDFEKLFGECCRPWIAGIEKSCERTIDQTIWIKLD